MYEYSIIIPVYNVEKYLNRCLQSVQNQNYESSKFQVIIIDDGSSDSSADICKDFVAKNSTWEYHYFGRDNESGLGNARNKGLSYAKGEYIFFLDSDDYISGELLFKATKYRNDYDYDLLMFNFTREYENPNFINKIVPNHLKMKYSEGKISKKDFAKMSHSAWSKIFKRSAFLNLQFKNTIFEDIPLILDVLNTDKLLIIEDSLLTYNVRNDSIMSQKFDEEKFTKAIYLLDELEDSIDNNYLTEFHYRKLKFGYFLIIYNMWMSKYDKKRIQPYIIEMNKLILPTVKQYMSISEKAFVMLMNYKYKGD